MGRWPGPAGVRLASSLISLVGQLDGIGDPRPLPVRSETALDDRRRHVWPRSHDGSEQQGVHLLSEGVVPRASDFQPSPMSCRDDGRPLRVLQVTGGAACGDGHWRAKKRAEELRKFQCQERNRCVGAWRCADSTRPQLSRHVDREGHVRAGMRLAARRRFPAAASAARDSAACACSALSQDTQRPHSTAGSSGGPWGSLYGVGCHVPTGE